MVRASLSDKIIESATDEEGIYPLKDKHATDHIVLTCTIDTKMRVEQTTGRRWKIANKNSWTKVNNKLKTAWNKMREETRDMTKLQQIITETLEAEIGSTKTNPNRKEKITNPEIKQARLEMKNLRKEFKEACNNHYKENKNK